MWNFPLLALFWICEQSLGFADINTLFSQMQSGLLDRSTQNITPMSRGAHYQPLSTAFIYEGRNETIHPPIPLIWMRRDFVTTKHFYKRHHLSIPNLALNFYQVFVLPGNVSKIERFCFRVAVAANTSFGAVRGLAGGYSSLHGFQSIVLL